MSINLNILNTKHLIVVLFLFGFFSSCITSKQKFIPKPSTDPNKAQLKQIERKYGMFLHFGVNTFHDMEWTDGSKPASSYNPDTIDADQWIKTAKDAGMKYVILITKHHDGFCLWDSKYTDYDVGNSGNTTNVVKAVAKACKKYDIGLGLYYSLWDRKANGNDYITKKHPFIYEDNPELDKKYNDYMLNQINELIDIAQKQEVPVVEFWFDGGWTKANTRWPLKEIYQTIKSREPECQIGVNWTIGLPENPDFHAVYPKDQKAGYPIRYFPSDFRLGDPMLPAENDPKIFTHQGKNYYMPWESTVCISKRWFYNSKDTTFKSVDELVDLYQRATAQNNMLILNCPPTREGKLRSKDIKLLTELKKRLNLTSSLPNDNFRIWIGQEYWANPLEDWQLNKGQMECVTSGGYRNIFLLTNEIDSNKGDFELTVQAKNLNAEELLTDGWIGFEIGIKGEFDDYRDNAIRGRGFPVGITTNGMLFIGDLDTTKQSIKGGLDRPEISLRGNRQQDGKYTLSLTVKDASTTKTIKRSGIHSKWIEGGLSLMCHSGKFIPFTEKKSLSNYPTWGSSPAKRRGGNVKFGFSKLKLSGSKIKHYKERAFGPILFALHTLSKGTLKLTAQMPPTGEKDGQTVDLQIKSNDRWKTIATEKIDELSRTATFKIKDWKVDKDIPYRLAYKLYDSGNQLKNYFYEGIIRKEPFAKKEIVVAAFTGNNDLGFPNTDIVNSIKYHNPDVLFFSGDQIYEGVGDYGALINRKDLKKSTLNYLRKWYLFGWAYNDLIKDRPTVCITDDHDVFHGNIWGAGGIATPPGLQGAAAQDLGGYKMVPEWVNMVQRTQTAHLPDPYDPAPVAQGIGVYYTGMNYGGISFAILEDRKFKSAPKPLLPEAKIYNGWMQNHDFDAKKADVKGAVLLGDRQLRFLENWSADWSDDIQMKVVLSQTIFANVATLPYEDSHSDNIVPKLRIMKKGDYPPDDIPVSDFDSNGWPQTGRNNALKKMRKSFAFHIAGDQHLGSTIQYGVEDYHDAGYAFCVPSISNVWPRRWYPVEGGENRIAGAPKYTGDFIDGFGNKMTVHAVSNPVYTGIKPSKLYDRATGYGIVRFNKESRNITVECWPRQANPEKDKQYEGWPVIINQEDNFMKNARFSLPEIVVSGVENPVIQLIDERNKDIVYTLRLKGAKHRPKLTKEGFYTIKITDMKGQKEKTISHISTNDDRKIIKVDLSEY